MNLSFRRTAIVTDTATVKLLFFRLIAGGCAIGLLGLASCDRTASSAVKAQPTSTPQATAPTPKTSSPDPSWLRLGLPIQCQLNRDCFVMQYVDRDPDENEAIDFACGQSTYDKHSGTDFAIPDEQAMTQGVNAIASADGTVLRVRDGVEDRRLKTDAEVEQMRQSQIECGNGLVVDHGNGWETQYCHLRQGSIQVQAGSPVKKGDVVGQVGLSGLTQFPHVHLSVRYQGQEVDPFVGPTAEAGCEVIPRPIWEQSIAYKPTGLVRAGFATEQPTFDALWEGRFAEIQLAKDIPALIFWVFSHGVQTGDIEQYRLIDPSGKEFLKQESPVNSNSRIWVSYAGKRNTAERPIALGTWRGEYQLKRGDRVVFEVTREVDVK